MPVAKRVSWVLWLTPVMLAIREAEMRGSQFEVSLDKKLV
jgi:hypothetical protein